MRPAIVGIPLILLYSALMVNCESAGSNADQSKIQQIEHMWEDMPLYSGLVEVSARRASASEKAHISKSFKSTEPYQNVRGFYVARLTKDGWQLVTDRKMYDWWRDLGGQYLEFTKGEYKLSIEYAGEKGSKGWDYGIGIYWADL